MAAAAAGPGGPWAEILHRAGVEEAALRPQLRGLPVHSERRQRLVHRLAQSIRARIDALGRLEAGWRAAGRAAWADEMRAARRKAALEYLLGRHDLGELIATALLEGGLDADTLGNQIILLLARSAPVWR